VWLSERICVSVEPLVRLEAVGKSYSTAGALVEALPAVDAQFTAGTITAVVGVSGSGKSTLLKLIAGHDTPSTGVVIVAGNDVAALSRGRRNRFLRNTATYVSQRAADNLFPQLTLEQHLPSGASRRPFELLGIETRINARADELSGGELARASFAVALAQGSPLLVVDEPTAELDRATAQDVLAAMRESTSRGQTVIVATHDPDVVSLADNTLDLTQRRPAATVPPASRGDDAPGRVALELDGLTKLYAGSEVLREASLTICAGELGLIVGRSGSGKSTLLMVAGSWIEPDHGTVQPRQADWRQVAFVPQRFGLVPELTVRENIELPARLARAAPNHDLLDRLAISDLSGRYPAEISIGQQQRVAIARALRLDPTILLIDEPTSHQDAAYAELVWAAIRTAATNGSACLVATHELDATGRADRWWRIQDGRLHTDPPEAEGAGVMP
jgi:ABC-type lipoprotein export system ATPase subunit